MMYQWSEGAVPTDLETNGALQRVMPAVLVPEVVEQPTLRRGAIVARVAVVRQLERRMRLLHVRG